MADATALHRALVDDLVGRGCITDSRLEEAFRAVPRRCFLPGVALEEVYRDQAIPTKFIDNEAVSSSSQPEIMAVMLAQLGLERGHRVLEIGAGTGYNAALMAHLVGETGSVVTMDIDDDLVQSAREHLASIDCRRVRVVQGDGSLGAPDGAPWDRIILTVGAWDIAPAWREQLGREGRLVLPLRVGGSEKSVAFIHDGDHLVSVSVKDCQFMPLRGAFAAPRDRVRLGTAPGLHLYARNAPRLDAERAHSLLTGPAADLATGVLVTPGEVYGGLILWVAVREVDFSWLAAIGADADTQPVPHLFALAGKHRSSAGVFEGTRASFFMRPPGDRAPVARETEPRAFELFVRSFGDDGSLAHRLRQHARAWQAEGRPGTAGLRIRAFPIDAAYAPTAGEFVVTKRATRLVLDWPDQTGGVY